MFIRFAHWMLFRWTSHLQQRIADLEAKNKELQFELEESEDSTRHWYRRYFELINQRKVDNGTRSVDFIGDRFSSIQ